MFTSVLVRDLNGAITDNNTFSFHFLNKLSFSPLSLTRSLVVCIAVMDMSLSTNMAVVKGGGVAARLLSECA